MATMNDQKMHQKRILISGAGPIGLSFALGLKNSSFNITVIDQKERPSQALLEQDTRMIALSHRSVSFLKSIDLWAELKAFATPIERVEISEKGYATKVELEAFDHDLQDFGALIPLGRLVLGMLKAVDTCKNITYLDQTQLSNYQLQNTTNAGDSEYSGVAASTAISANCTLLHQGEKRTETFDWIVAAEGMHSQLRMLSGIESYHSDYNQVAVIARATFEYPHHNTAYERFTSDGPLALLPVGSHEMAAVLIAGRTEKEKWKSASDAVFSNEVIYRIGLDLGDIQSVTKRHVWDLTLMVPKEVNKPCLTLIGNSAHSLHPIAGQGLNLGFRDCELLLPYFKNGNIPTIFDLERYARERRHDVVKVAGATDFLVRGFGIDLPGASQLRNLALKSVNFIKPLKKRIAKFGMGY